jgi:uncharacterized membrane protein YebE (DUF533 family)
MKTSLRFSALATAFGLLLTATSCVSPYAGPNENHGAVMGAVGGGILGAIIGNQSGRPLEGAAIGGLLGSAAGSTLGASQDQRYYSYQPACYAPRPRPVIFAGYQPIHYGPVPFRHHVMISRHSYGSWGPGGRCW